MTALVGAALAACNMLVAATSLAQDVSFFARLQFDAGTDTISVVVGDFNGDGVQDVVVLDSGWPSYLDSGVSVLLGNGNGTFQRAQYFRAGGGPRSVAIGDFNGDGVQDLAVANYGTPPLYQDAGVSVLLGNGDGSFGAPRNFAVGDNPRAVLVEDFNGDGVQDLALIIGRGGIWVLLGNGDGSFQPARGIGGGVNARLLVVGDFNGDGVLDLAVGRSSDRFFLGGINVFLGNGDGKFRPAPNIDGSYLSLAVGDFNGDGVLDLVAPGGPGLDAWVFLGNGDGTFQPRRHFSAGDGYGVAVGDFNGDGAQDLVITEFFNTVTVVLGDGNGSFQVAPKLEAGDAPWSVAVGDFNGDGVQDLVVANNYSNNASVLLGNGNGTFRGARNFAAGNFPRSVAVGDFNGDGLQDFVVTNYYSNNASLLLGNGDGTFQAARDVATRSNPRFVAAGDFNGDGVLDLAVADGDTRDNGGVSVLLGIGDGSFQPALTFALGRFTQSIAVGDFNGDGTQDLAVANATPSPPYDTGLAVLLGNGDGRFHAAQYFAAGVSPTFVAVGDFNGDGVQDLAVANYGTFSSSYEDAGASVLLGNGDGTFQAAQYFRAGNSAVSLAVGDFNGDGVQDLVIVNERTHGVSALLGNGDGNFQYALTFGTGMGPESVAVGDFNGDGRQDLAVAHGYTFLAPRGSFHDWGVSVLINNSRR